MIFVADFLHFASSVTCQPLHLPVPTLGSYFGTPVAGVAHGGGETHLFHMYSHLKPPQISPFLAPGCESPYAILFPSPENVPPAEGHI